MFSRHVALYAAVFFSGFLGSALPSLPCTHRPSRSEDRRARSPGSSSKTSPTLGEDLYRRFWSRVLGVTRLSMVTRGSYIASSVAEQTLYGIVGPQVESKRF